MRAGSPQEWVSALVRRGISEVVSLSTLRGHKREAAVGDSVNTE